MPDVVGLPLRKARLLVRERRARRRRHHVPGVVRDARHGARAEAAARADGLRRRQGDARASRARATSSGCRRSTSAPTSTGATSSATSCGSCSTCSDRSRRSSTSSTPTSIPTRRRRSSCRGWPRGRRWSSRRTGRSRRSAASSARRSSSIASAAPSRGSSSSSRCSPGTSRTSKRTSGRSAAGASASPRRSASTRWCCRRSTWRTPSSSRCRSSYKDVSPESVIRIHEIIQMEKPANTQYYLRFAAEGGGNDLSEFMAIGGGVIGGIGLGADEAEVITSEEDLQARARRPPKQAATSPQATADSRKTQMLEIDAQFQPMPRTKPPLPKAPRADTAPVEGKEGPRSSKAGGFEGAAREMAPISNTQAMEADQDDRVDERKPSGDETKARGRRLPTTRSRRQDGRRRRQEGRKESEEGSGEKVNGDRTRRESAGLQEDQLLQGVPHHRARLERRRALSPREAQAAQPALPRARRHPGLLRRAAR